MRQIQARRKLTAMLSLRSLFARSETPEVRAGRARMAIDHRDPDRRFAFGVLAVQYSVDPAYLPVHAAFALRDWYGLGSTVAVRERILQYLMMRGRDPGYDLFRAAFLARAGFGAGLLGQDESWHRALAIADEVKSRFTSWASYADSFRAGHLELRRQQGDAREVIAEHDAELARRIARLHRTIWNAAPFPAVS